MRHLNYLVFFLFIFIEVIGQDCPPTEAFAQLDVNNVRADLQVGGDLWWDFSNAGYEVPKDSGIHSIFCGSLWIGGLDETGNIRLAAQTYRQGGDNDYFAGPLYDDGLTTVDQCNAFDSLWSVYGYEIDAFLLDLEDDVLEEAIPQSILRWPGKNNPNNINTTNRELAPFHDADGDGSYNPIHGDYPILGYERSASRFADQMVWWVYNDAGGPHWETESDPMHLEVQATAFAFATGPNDALNDQTFYHHKLINKGIYHLDSMSFGQWVDPDLGNYNDDYVGCDTLTNVFYVYNADDADEGQDGYGMNIPIQGIQFIQTGKDQNSNEYLGMSNFIYYDSDAGNNGNPNGAQEIFHFLYSRWRDGTSITYGGNGETGTVPTNYMFPSQPNNPNGWSECSEGNPPADRRGLAASGPFKLDPGAVVEYTMGALWTRDEVEYPCPDIAPLINLANYTQQYYENGFQLIDGPDAPNLEFEERDNQLMFYIIPYGNNEREAFEMIDFSIPQSRGGMPIEDRTYNFEGYQLYQLVNGKVNQEDYNDPTQARLVLQMDIENDIRSLINYEYDQNLNAYQGTRMVEAGNVGIEHQLIIDQDAFGFPSGRITNHQTYYYSIVSYAHNEYEKFDPENPLQKAQDNPYLAGHGNVKVYEVVPYKQNPLINEIHIVPNPYYAISRYEQSGNEKRVKITNVPDGSFISIFDMEGTKINTLEANIGTNVRNGSVIWDLTNYSGHIVGSGIYIVHINLPSGETKTLKWFGVTRE